MSFVSKVDSNPAPTPAWKRHQAATLATNRSAGVALNRQSEDIYDMWMIKYTSKGIRRVSETPDGCHKMV